MKKIIVDGSEIEVLDYDWIVEPYPCYNIDYIKVKISRQNCKEILKKILYANEYVIEADNKKAKFYMHVDETKRLFDWYKSDSDEIEIEFVGTVNEVD